MLRAHNWTIILLDTVIDRELSRYKTTENLTEALVTVPQLKKQVKKDLFPSLNISSGSMMKPPMSGFPGT